MIPLRDLNPTRIFPFVTRGIIAVNVLVFIWELTLGRQLPQAFVQFAIIPARYTLPAEASEIYGHFPSYGAALLPFLSSMFLHGGWLHLIGNMWFLWIFGDNVEERLGSWRYLLLYLGSGIAAALLHIFTNLTSAMPTLGASGAIAGIMGAYFRFFPGARVETVIPPFFLWPITLPAVVFLGWWFFLQFYSGIFSVGAHTKQFTGIAWWAHVGGFAFGLVVCLFAQRKKMPPLIPRYLKT